MMTRTREPGDDMADEIQNQGARIGAQASGGIAAQPGDPTSPQAATARAEAANRALEGGGFGKHDSVNMDKPTGD